HLVEHRGAIVAGEAQALPALVPQVIAEETLWACTTCGYCEAACPIVLEDPAQGRDLDYLFYVGSAESFDLRGRRIATAFARVLQAAGVRFAILGAREGSTGECVRRAGNEMLFQSLAASLVATLSEFGIRRIVTCDPHAYNTLKNEYPQFGGHYEVVHHTQLVERLLREDRIRVDARFERVI